MIEPKACGLCKGQGFNQDVEVKFWYTKTFPVKCVVCNGTGVLPPIKPEKCPHCGKELI